MTHPQLVESMANASFYPHRPQSIELIQTHISFIFIAGEEVFKVKKAVDFGFLDFTTLEKRKHFCQEELRLNRRLAPEVYLDVVQISEDHNGYLVLGAGDRIVEYAIRMKKIPEDRMLKKLIPEGKVAPSIMDRVAKTLAEFHARAETGGAIDLIGGFATIRRNHEENFAQTEKYIGSCIPEYQYRFIKHYVQYFMEEHRPLFERRVAEQKIRDCHGDLHLEHICIGEEIMIFDCIEFNERFRYEDVAAEVAFLAMDLDYNGYPDWADIFVKAYVRYAGDPDLYTLLNFYKCYYAYVRGKVVSFRIDDEAIKKEDRDEAQRTAARYFDLAYTYASRLPKPSLILTCGLMGAGKSHLAKNIGARFDAHIIRTDVLRKSLLNINPGQRHHEDFGKGIYTDDITRRTYDEALNMAAETLQSGRSVIIDASFKRQKDRLIAAERAKTLQADFFIIECTCPEEEIKARLEARMAKKGEASDGRWEIYREQKRGFEEITEFSDGCYIVVDTSGKREESMNCAIEGIKGKSRIS